MLPSRSPSSPFLLLAIAVACAAACAHGPPSRPSAFLVRKMTSDEVSECRSTPCLCGKVDLAKPDQMDAVRIYVFTAEEWETIKGGRLSELKAGEQTWKDDVATQLVPRSTNPDARGNFCLWLPASARYLAQVQGDQHLPATVVWDSMSVPNAQVEVHLAAE